jgi:hypothetical protein
MLVRIFKYYLFVRFIVREFPNSSQTLDRYSANLHPSLLQQRVVTSAIFNESLGNNVPLPNQSDSLRLFQNAFPVHEDLLEDVAPAAADGRGLDPDADGRGLDPDADGAGRESDRRMICSIKWSKPWARSATSTSILAVRES